MSSLDNLRKVWDTKAELYDQEDRRKPVIEWMNCEQTKILRYYLTPGMNVLELGCGTGEEAIYLARTGVNVYATDLSPEMVRLTQTKVQRYGLTDYVRVHELNAEDVFKLIPHKFNGIYFFGAGLNCLPDIKKFARTILQLLLPGGYFIVTVLNKFCVSEILGYSIKLNFNLSLRRLRTQPVPVKFYPDLPAIRVRYYTPGRFYDYFRKYFQCIFLRALPLLSPFPGLNRIYSPRLRFFSKILEYETRVSTLFPINRWGDHFLMVLKKIT